MKKATMLKSKRYKFGKGLAKGQKVWIKDDNGVLTAFTTEDSYFGFGVSVKDITYGWLVSVDNNVEDGEGNIYIDASLTNDEMEERTNIGTVNKITKVFTLGKNATPDMVFEPLVIKALRKLEAKF